MFGWHPRNAAIAARFRGKGKLGRSIVHWNVLVVLGWRDGSVSEQQLGSKNVGRRMYGRFEGVEVGR